MTAGVYGDAPRDTDTADLLLPDEDERQPPARLDRRRLIYSQMRTLPDEVFARLMYFQPQVGCFNRCVFCSQHAGTELWQLTREGLRDVVAALRRAARERPHIGRIGRDRIHKPGVLFPYVDNDIGSYRYLDEYLRLARDALDAKVRITTIGFSSRNRALVAMHQDIVENLADAIAGLRLSVTPFTVGWTDGNVTGAVISRRQFEADTAAMLALYKPMLEKVGTGKETMAVELRFRPLVATLPVVDTIVAGRHAILVGPHLVLARREGRRPEANRVVGVVNDVPGRRDETIAPEPVFAHGGDNYVLVTSDRMAADGIDTYVRRVLAGDLAGAECREVTVYLMEHRDGNYYAIDPGFVADGTMRSLVIYPAAPHRTSGYNDTTRFMLNTLLKQKYRRGYGRRDEFTDATVRDVAAVILRLRRRAAELGRCDELAGRHVQQEVLPLVVSYARALLTAGLDPSLFFSRRFTIDTGQSVNQGRGHVLFKGLLSTNDIPANPWEERGNYISAHKGYVWRVAPMPYSQGGLNTPGPARSGRKNDVASEPSLMFVEMDPRHLEPRDFDTGQPLRRYQVSGVEIEHVTLKEGQRKLLFPGLAPTPSEQAEPGGTTQ
ncbi:hypothetical protein [Micromonospora sp. NPDC005652]|uniref:hypothetical protein n=1 Tax=Micromonospora sp. NPDC005652 TaxID=3157046 RepID=UPI00340F182D